MWAMDYMLKGGLRLFAGSDRGRQRTPFMLTNLNIGLLRLILCYLIYKIHHFSEFLSQRR